MLLSKFKGQTNATDGEIIYELRWKSDGDRDKTKIMGILDTPETCSDWPTFKSYLMQNSGIDEEVSVSYIRKSGNERMISSENFNTAIAFAREQAQRGDKVTLILNKPKSKLLRKHKDHRHEKRSSRSENEKPRMQSLFDRIKKERVVESEDEETVPPEWFTAYMTSFRQDLNAMLRQSLLLNMELVDIVLEEIDNRRDPKSDRRRKHTHGSKTCEEELSTDELTTETASQYIGPKLARYIQKLEAKEMKIERKYEAIIGKLETKFKRRMKKSSNGQNKLPKETYTKIAVIEEADSTKPVSESPPIQKPERYASRRMDENSYAELETRATSAVIQKLAAKEKRMDQKYAFKMDNLGKDLRCIVKRSVAKHPKYSKKRREIIHGVTITEPLTESPPIQKPEKSVTRAEESPCTRSESSEPCVEFQEQEDPKMLNMNAHQLDRQMHCEYVKRGQIVTKSWEVMNTGLAAWNDETCLRFTWGSSSLVPLAKCLKVPKLKPGEVGVVSVLLQAPDAVGRFESYWHFYHNNVRFGQWLGCAYVINEETSDSFEVPLKPIKAKPLGTTDDMKMSKDIVLKPESYDNRIEAETANSDSDEIIDVVGIDSDSDNISVISGTISVTSCTDQADDYVMIAMPHSPSDSESDSSEASCPELINLDDDQAETMTKSPVSDFQQIETFDCQSSTPSPVLLKPETPNDTETVLKPDKHFSEQEKTNNKPNRFDLTTGIAEATSSTLIEFPENSCAFDVQSNIEEPSSDTRHFVFAKNGTGFETFKPDEPSESDIPERISARYAYVYGKGNRPIPTDSERRSVTPDDLKAVHILPETIVNGAIQVASNAFNTAVNVYEMIRASTEDVMEQSPLSPRQRTPLSTPTPLSFQKTTSQMTTPPTASKNTSVTTPKSTPTSDPKNISGTSSQTPVTYSEPIKTPTSKTDTTIPAQILPSSSQVPAATAQASKSTGQTVPATETVPPKREKTIYDRGLKILFEMGFRDNELNLKLLKRHNNNLYDVIPKLI